MTMAIETPASAQSDEVDGTNLLVGDAAEAARAINDQTIERVVLVEPHEGIDDHAMGQIFVRGTAVGVPVTWAISTLMLNLLPIGLPVAAGAAIFVAIASGPFFGSTVFLMAKIIRLDRKG